MDHIKAAYDAEVFRREGHALIDMLADYLQAAQRGEQMDVLPWQETGDALRSWAEDLIQARHTDRPLHDFFQKVLNESIHIHHPNYMGHQISPAAPAAALGGLLSDFLNNGMGVYEMGIVGSTLDRIIIRQVAEQMGFGPEADGVMTSGGTIANITALLTARSIKVSPGVWENGTPRQLALMVSEQAHYCVDRAARIMGWGADGIIKVPTNDQYQMRTELLESYYRDALDRGIEVIAVVGSACSTSTGSFDDLSAIANFCAAKNLWFHVDGAHGAALVYSEQYRDRVAGIERADSVIMDFHKMLLTPSITTALVFKDGKQNFSTFSQEAQYLFEEQEGLDWYNMAKRTFECTKTMMSLKVYSILQSHGTQLFDQYVSRVVALGEKLGQLVKQHPDFELAMEPQCNIVCFRHAPRHLPETELNAHNETLRNQMKASGRFYIVKTNLRGQIFLRCTLTNPFTEEQHMRAMLEALEALAKG